MYTNESKPEQVEVRKGPWTMEEDMILINYIAMHGEGVWNSLAQAAGLKRTGKSCRLRWLNYLKPDVRRGNITSEEQLLIMELHAKWGNRWSKIAKHLPGRTDNEIKNFWRTRIHKQLKQRVVHDDRHRHHERMIVKCDPDDHSSPGPMSFLVDQLFQLDQQAASTSHSAAPPPMAMTTTTAADDHDRHYDHHVAHPYYPPSIDEDFLGATVPLSDVNLWNLEDISATMQFLYGE